MIANFPYVAKMCMVCPPTKDKIVYSKFIKKKFVFKKNVVIFILI